MLGYGVSRERFRERKGQIEATAQCKPRHPNRSGELRSFLVEDQVTVLGITHRGR